MLKLSALGFVIIDFICDKNELWNYYTIIIISIGTNGIINSLPCRSSSSWAEEMKIKLIKQD